MQAGNNAIRPTSGDGNGVWISSNTSSPQGPAVLYTNVNKNVYKKTKRRRLERLLIIAGIFIFILFLGLSLAIYLVAEMGDKGNVCFSPNCIHAAAKLLSSMDLAVNPCDNFYAYACGNWRTSHPSSDPVYIRNWFQQVITKQNQDSIDYLERNNSDTEPQSVHDARLFYSTCMDFESMEETGLETLWDLLDKIGLPKNPLADKTIMQPWIKSLAKARRYLAMDVLIGSGVIASLKNSSINQIIIGIPDGEQNLPGTKWKWEDKIKNKKMKKKVKDDGAKILQAWKKYATKIIEYVITAAENVTEVSTQELNDAAFTLLDIQREILLLEDNEDVKQDALNQFPDVYTLKQLQNLTDNATNSDISKLNWKDFFDVLFEDIGDDGTKFDDEEPVSVGNVHYVELLSQLLEETDDKTIELLLWWNVIYSVSPHVNEDLKNLKQAFEKNILQTSDKSRSLVCCESATLLMTSAVGYQVKEYGDQSTISEISDMLSNIRGAFAKFIFDLDWMDVETMYATVDKLYKMTMFIGYPKWYDDMDIMDALYENITLTNTSHLQNILNLIEEEVYSELANLDVVNNTTQDYYDPTDVNAYYDPTTNSINVPYAILQQPFYNMGLQALNYGAIGAILGHELTHGLDNTGRMYDKSGNYRMWWSNFSSEEYVKRESCYREAYSNFHIESIDSNVNGATTLGENIADDGGIRDSLAAYRLYIKKHGKEAKLPGFLNYTHDQLFFLSFANMWCAEYSDEALKRILEDDEHSPNFARVIVVLQNVRDFSDTWKCPKGSYMNPEKKCNLWI